MANYSRWEDIKSRKGVASAETRAVVEQDLDLGQLIYDLRTGAGLSQRELAERMGTTQSVISRLEEGGGARNRIDTLARVAKALDRHLVLSFPSEAPYKLTDAGHRVVSGELVRSGPNYEKIMTPQRAAVA